MKSFINKITITYLSYFNLTSDLKYAPNILILKISIYKKKVYTMNTTGVKYWER